MARADGLDGSERRGKSIAPAAELTSDGNAALIGHWTEIAALLRRDIGARTFDQWVKHVRPIAFDAASGELVMGAPSAFTAEQIASRFGDRLTMAWQMRLPQVRSVQVTAAKLPTVARTAMPALVQGCAISSKGWRNGLDEIISDDIDST